MDFLITEDDCKNLGFFCVENKLAGIKQHRYRKYPRPGVIFNVIFIVNSDGDRLAAWVEVITDGKMRDLNIQTIEELKVVYKSFKETILTT